jgi:hypothetical protein
MKYSMFLLFFLLIPAVGMAATYHVPTDFPSIQGALSSALTVSGDTVIVLPGIYAENIDFLGKDIHLKSLEGPKATFIDGNMITSVVTFTSGEGPGAIIEGFTIRHGSGTMNAVGNVYGGGIFIKGSRPTVRGNIIRNNQAMNTPFSEGGGIHCEDMSAPTIESNTFFKNKAWWHGGGLNCLDNCTVTLVNNVFFGNTVEADGRGAGIAMSKFCVLIATNNTLTMNQTGLGGQGGGLFCSLSSKAAVENTIFYLNNAPLGPEIYVGETTAISTVAISYSDLWGGVGSTFVEPGCSLFTGAGMINADPLFVNLAAADCHITYPSPCFNTGNNLALALPTTDYEGDPRPELQTVDIGADEFSRHLYYPGDAYAGGTVDLTFVGFPGTTPVDLYASFAGFLGSPIPTPFGDWYLMFPFLGPFSFAPIPASGAEVITITIPPAPPGPYSIYLQALIGPQLSNLCILHVN